MRERALVYASNSSNYFDMTAAPDLILVASMSMSVPVLPSLQHHHDVCFHAAASSRRWLGGLPPSDKDQLNF